MQSSLPPADVNADAPLSTSAIPAVDAGVFHMEGMMTETVSVSMPPWVVLAEFILLLLIALMGVAWYLRERRAGVWALVLGMLLLAVNHLPVVQAAIPLLQSSHAASSLVLVLLPLQPWLGLLAVLLLAVHVFAEWRRAGEPQASAE